MAGYVLLDLAYIRAFGREQPDTPMRS